MKRNKKPPATFELIVNCEPNLQITSGSHLSLASPPPFSGTTIEQALAYIETYLYVPSLDEIIARASDEDVFEIYDLSFQVKYQSENYLSATQREPVDEIDELDWREIWDCSDEVATEIETLFESVVSGQVTKPLFDPFGVVTMKEVGRPKGVAVRGRTKVLVPVYDGYDRTIAGALHIFQVESVQSLNFKVREAIESSRRSVEESKQLIRKSRTLISNSGLVLPPSTS